MSGYGFISDSSKRDLTKPFVCPDVPSQPRVPLQVPETKSKDIVGELMMMTKAGLVGDEPNEIESCSTDSATSVQIIHISQSSDDVGDTPNRTNGGESSTDIQSTGIRAETTASQGGVERVDEPKILRCSQLKGTAFRAFGLLVAVAGNEFSQLEIRFPQLRLSKVEKKL